MRVEKTINNEITLLKSTNTLDVEVYDLFCGEKMAIV